MMEDVRYHNENPLKNLSAKPTKAATPKTNKQGKKQAMPLTP